MAQPPKPLDVAAIKETEAPSQAADDKTRHEERDLERQEYGAHIDGLKQDIKERKVYAGRIFSLLSIWLIGMFLLLLLQGFGKHLGFILGENVLMAAIGGTTINVIGIFLVVVRYLFPQRGPFKQK